MTIRGKNILYSIVLLVAVVAVSLYRRNKVVEPIRVEGRTMGTTYHITYFDEKERNFENAIDSILVVVNKSINNYDTTSEVSRFNQSEKGVGIKYPYFYPPLKKSEEVNRASGGAFDPTIMPLVNAWGFGAGKQLSLDNAKVDSIKAFVGFERIRFTEDSVLKSKPNVQLDFGGIGQGYGADVVTDFLRSKGVTNMLVELGGEGKLVAFDGKSLRRSFERGWDKCGMAHMVSAFVGANSMVFAQQKTDGKGQEL